MPIIIAAFNLLIGNARDQHHNAILQTEIQDNYKSRLINYGRSIRVEEVSTDNSSVFLR